MDCRPPGDRRNADRLYPSTRRMKNEGMEPQLAALSVERGPVFRPGPLVRQIKDLTLAIGPSLSLSLSLSRSHISALSFPLSPSLFYTFPSQFLCLSSQSVRLYQESPLVDTSLSFYRSSFPVILRLFSLSPFGEDMSCRNRAFVPHPTFTKYTD